MQKKKKRWRQSKARCCAGALCALPYCSEAHCSTRISLGRSCTARIVNAGDGVHAHPTQALLDALTLREALGDLEGRTIAIVGDIGHSRVARSNVHALTMLGASVRLAGPAAWVEGFAGWPGVTVATRLEDALADADAVMALRIQRERLGVGGPSIVDYVAAWRLDEARMQLEIRERLFSSFKQVEAAADGSVLWLPKVPTGFRKAVNEPWRTTWPNRSGASTARAA